MSFRLIFRDFCLVLCVTLTLQQKEREYDGTLIGPSINYLLYLQKYLFILRPLVIKFNHQQANDRRSKHHFLLLYLNLYCIFVFYKLKC